MTENQFAWTFPAGNIHQEVTSVPLVNNTELIIDVSVPTGKIWFLLGVKAVNGDDVARDITIVIYKEAAKTNLLKTLNYANTADGVSLQWPASNNSATLVGMYSPQILVAANKISITWAAGGASTGATDADGLIIEYLEIDTP